MSYQQCISPEVNTNMPRKRINVQDSINNLAQKVKRSSDDVEIDYLKEKVTTKTSKKNRARPALTGQQTKPVKEREKNELGFQIVTQPLARTSKRAYSKFYFLLIGFKRKYENELIFGNKIGRKK